MQEEVWRWIYKDLPGNGDRRVLSGDICVSDRIGAGGGAEGGYPDQAGVGKSDRKISGGFFRRKREWTVNGRSTGSD